MNTPKVLLSMIKFSEQNVQKADWYRISVKDATRCSLINFYAQKFYFQLISPLDPWEGQVVAEYNYKKILAKVDEDILGFVVKAAASMVDAKSLYDVLCVAARRREVLFRRYDRLLWYDWRQRRALKKRIQKIDNEEIELSDFLNMAVYLFENYNLGKKSDFVGFFC